MSDDQHSPVAARRFLHCCYCCRDADAATRFFCDVLGLELRMRSTADRVDGRQMGFPGDVETDACFVYDRRGPRVSPAIEVQAWIDPPTVGQPYAAAHDVGLQALGIGVPDLDAALERLAGSGSVVLGRTDAASPISPTSAIVRDPTGVIIDVVESRTAGEDTRMTHLRATCSDLDRSVAWYVALGFDVTDEHRRVRLPGEPFDIDGAATASVARLRLPDEPFGLVLVEWHDPPSTGVPYDVGNHAGLYRFAIGVDDARAAYDALVRAGLAVLGPPELVELPGTNVPEMWIAFLADPDGMTIELVERPRSAFR
jgi:catechol 2,3-dioxygenase-like lactoylglutathione lyase family enzyme